MVRWEGIKCLGGQWEPRRDCERGRGQARQSGIPGVQKRAQGGKPQKVARSSFPGSLVVREGTALTMVN